MGPTVPEAWVRVADRWRSGRLGKKDLKWSLKNMKTTWVTVPGEQRGSGRWLPEHRCGQNSGNRHDWVTSGHKLTKAQL